MPCLTRSRMLRALLLKLRGAGHDNNFNIQSREEFTVAACHAAFEFLPNERHNEFANWLYDKAGGIFISNPNHADLIFYNRNKVTVDVYDEASITNGDEGELIETASVKMYLQQLYGFLEAPTNTPFIIVGPAGVAKTLLIEHAVHELSGYELITINCTTQLTPAYVIHCLKQVKIPLESKIKQFCWC